MEPAVSQARGLATWRKALKPVSRGCCAGEVAAAAIHFHGTVADANVDAVAAMPRLSDAVLVGFVRREQGLLLEPGNPKSLNGSK